MNAYVDPDLCIGCTQCAGLCPAVFQMEGTLAVAKPGPIPPEEVPQAGEAATACPVAAIRLEEEGGRPSTMWAAFSLFYAKIPRWARFCGIMQNV